MYLQQSVGEIRLNHEQTLINGKLFVNKDLVAEKVLAFNNTMHFISQDQIFIEANNAINGHIGSIHIGKEIPEYVFIAIKSKFFLSLNL